MISIRFKASLLTIFTFTLLASSTAFAQDRDRVVTRSTNQGLRNEVTVKKSPIKKTSSAKRVAPKAKRAAYMPATTRGMMMASIRSKLGLRYRYGSQGPRTYDCSGFVWKVFNEAGIPLTRTSARVYYRQFPKVTGDERYQFGTLVFFNRLGHMGIVVDEKGFYHASSSRGVTYSKFKGYWAKRIVGFRRVPIAVPNWDDVKEEIEEETEKPAERPVKIISN